MSWQDNEDASGVPEAEAAIPPLGCVHVEDMEFFPLTSPGMPAPGPDFVGEAVNLGDPKPKRVGKGDEARMEDIGPWLETLYRDALYKPRFSLKVKLKGVAIETAFIPGHIWGGAVAGPKPARIMIVGKWPGKEELIFNRNFVGPSGIILMQCLEEAGLCWEEFGYWYITNLCKYANPDPASNKPASSHMANCAVLLAQELRLVKPEYVLALGAEAYSALVGKGEGSISSVQGRVFDRSILINRSHDEPAVEHHFKVIACIHPAAVAHSPDNLPAFKTGIGRFIEQISGRAAAVPKEKYDFRTIYNAQHLGAVVDEILEEDPGPPVAIDCEWHGEYPTEPDAWLRTIQFSHKPSFAGCIVLRAAGGKQAFRPTLQEIAPHLRRLLITGRGKKPRLIGHNIRADLPWLCHLDPDLGKELIESSTCPDNKLTPDGKVDEWGYELARNEGGFDTMLAAHSIRETDRSYSLDILALQYCGLERYDQDLQKWKARYCKEHKLKAEELGGYGMCPDHILHPYSMLDVIATQKLFHKFNDELLSKDMYGNDCWIPFWISMRAHVAFLEMEMTGLAIDRRRGERLAEAYLRARERLRKQLIELFRWPGFNPNSAQQCKVALFGKSFCDKIDKETGEIVDIMPRADSITLNLMPIKTAGKPAKEWEKVVHKKQTHLYRPSTDKEVLGGLMTRLAGDIKNDKPHAYGWEHVNALRSFRFAGHVIKSVLRPPNLDAEGVTEKDEDDNEVFEKGLLASILSDGRVRTHFMQTKETARCSTVRPPLQNLAKRREKAYKDILGKDYPFPTRTMIAATPGWALVEADYVGAELFIMAVMSGDDLMIDHVLRSNLPDSDPNKYDIHSQLSVKAFGLSCPPTKQGLADVGMGHIRDVTKTMVFGRPYGRGIQAIVRMIEEEGTSISVEDAEVLGEAIMGTYSTMAAYMEEVGDRATAPGWLRNCFGRYRRFQRAKDDGGQAREAKSFIPQSSVADAVSRSLDHLYSWPDRMAPNGLPKFRIVMQLHDALLFEVQIPYLEWFVGTEEKKGVIGTCMTDRVTVWPCDLNGTKKPGCIPYHMGAEVSVYQYWGAKYGYDEGIALGIPAIYLPKPKKS